MSTLKEYSPDLAIEWDVLKNGARTPENTSIGSDFKAFWICKVCGHKWRTGVSHRTRRKTGCPKCKRMWNHSFPELALYFYVKELFEDTILDFALDINPFKSVDLFIPSIKLAIEYDGVQYHRNKREKDEEKSRLILEKGYFLLRIREEGLQDLSFHHPKMTLLKYQRRGEPSVNRCIQDVLWFLKEYVKSLNSLKKIIDKVDVIRDTIEILKQLPPVKQKGNLKDEFPELEKEWNFKKNHPFTPEHFKSRSNFQVWWACNNGHEFDAKIISRTKGHGCRFCSGLEVTQENSLETLYPDIAKEWSFVMNGELDPSVIHAHSNKVVYWQCPDCKSTYDKKVNERSGGRENCPYCAGKRVNQTNSLAALRPDLAKEWHPTKNSIGPEEVVLGSNYRATWICPRGHVYNSIVYSRTTKGGRGCKTCYEEIGRFKAHKVPFEKSVAKKKPFLIAQWDHEKNEVNPEEVGAYARQLIWWKCSNGCIWQQEPNSRNSSRCKKCRVKD